MAGQKGMLASFPKLARSMTKASAGKEGGVGGEIPTFEPKSPSPRTKFNNRLFSILLTGNLALAAYLLTKPGRSWDVEEGEARTPSQQQQGDLAQAGSQQGSSQHQHHRHGRHLPQPSSYHADSLAPSPAPPAPSESQTSYWR